MITSTTTNADVAKRSASCPVDDRLLLTGAVQQCGTGIVSDALVVRDAADSVTLVGAAAPTA